MRPPLLRCVSFLGAGSAVLIAASAVFSQPSNCPPGPATLVGASDLVVRAKPLQATLQKKDDMHYLRATYAIEARARGAEGIDQVVVEFSCIDMANPATGGADLGHCPNAEGIGIAGFERREMKFVAAADLVPLYLSGPAQSPLDGSDVFGDVMRRPFGECADAPRAFSSEEEEWRFIVEAEAQNKPSSPLAQYDEKVKQKAESQKPHAYGGCR